ncbi:MAG TPA: tetratricopeptide repeat protein [Patescibacteria group bacterium]|nr:tetratricopeptide repeat protein [Patescibacteria group bacterium]
MLLSTVLATSGMAGSVFAQSDSRLKLAESYEQSGDWRNAARMYQELYEAAPNSDTYFSGVIRSLKALNQFSSLLPIIEERLSKKKSVELYALYGEMLWKSGKAQPADEAWNEALKLAPKHPQTYMTVAQSQIDTRLFDKAISTFKKGRSAGGDENFFANELSELYTATGDYVNGTQEILKMYQAQPVLMSLAQGRLAALMISKEAAEHVREAVSRRADNHRDNLSVQRLYAWVLREAKDPLTAFSVYKRIDDLSQSQGRELLMFADASRNDGDFDIALKAYEAVMERGKTSPFFSTALYGYARTLEQKIQHNPNLGRNETEQIIKRYRSVIDEFPNTPVSAESQFRIAVLYARQLKDYDRALQEFAAVSTNNPQVVFAAESGIEAGNIYIIQDKLEQAVESFKNVIGTYKNRFAFASDRASYALAELEYFRGNMDTAQSLFAQVAVNPSSDVANDALQRMVMIDQNKQSLEALKLFAQGELFDRQQKFGDAVDAFLKVLAKAPQLEIAEKALLKAAENEFDRGKFSNARAHLDTLVLRYPESIYTDEALMLLGDCYTMEGMKEQAIFIYTDILTRFKHSIYLQEARDKIRRLRGDV